MTATDDRRTVVRMLAVSASGARNFRCFTIGGTPHAKMRARVNSKTGNVFTPKEEREAVKATQAALAQSWLRPDRGLLVASFLFYRPNHHRVDLDNLIKHVLDAANGILYRDDSQIRAIAARIDVDQRFPRTVLALGSID